VRQLDEHRQIHSRDDLDTVAVEKRQPDVRRRAAEHVGQNEYALGALDLRDGFRDRFARHGGIIVPANRHCDKLRQLSDDGSRGVHELVRQLTVGDDYDANHICLPFTVDRSPFEVARLKTPAGRRRTAAIHA
jgi:hypothetical protein